MQNAEPGIPQFFRVTDLARRLSVSEKTIIRRIQDDPDVRIITERKRGIRHYQTYLIPESTIQRLLERLRPRF